MAPDLAPAPSFDEIIQRDREERDRKAYQNLANDIFGKAKKERTQQNEHRKLGAGPSLASRVGITKTSQRSLSNPSKPRRNQDSPLAEKVSNGAEKVPRVTRTSRHNPMAEKTKSDLLSEALIAKGATNQTRSRPVGPEINIRGAAGPSVVIASNFAPGTTAADIESAMVPNGIEVSSCRIITASPTVMAEMVFNEKAGAERVIETFNGKKADGRILHVYMKTGGPTPIASPPAARRVQSLPHANTVDLTQNDSAPLDDRLRDTSDRNRRRPEPQVQDGRYGFASKEDQMEVDKIEPAEPAQSQREFGRRSDHQEAYRDDRYRQPDERYDDPPRDYGRNGYYDRGWSGGRPSDSRRMYSDARYTRYPARGYR